MKECARIAIAALVLGLSTPALVQEQERLGTADTAANEEWLDETAGVAATPQAASIPAEVNATVLTRGDGTPLSLGFVNLRRVMASIPQLSSLRSRLDSEFAQQKATLDQQANQIQSLENKLAQMPRGDEYSALEKQLISERRKITRLETAFRDAYSVRRNEELATLQQQVMDEIVGLAKDEGYDVILNDTGVIYVSGQADLTLMVIERLQKSAKEGRQ